jgi:TP901 family phage tail tape measure protein
MPDRIVRIVIAGDSAGGVRALRQTSVAAKETTASLDRTAASSGKFATAVAGLGKKLALGGLAAAGLGGFGAVKGMIALQKQMEMLHTQAGASQSQIGSMTTAVENMAGSVGTGPQSLAEGLYHVVSSLNATIPAAQRVSTEMKVLKIAAEGAKVGNANLVDVTNALDAAIVSGIKGVQNYGQAMGALNKIVGAGDMTMQDLADALGTGLLSNVKTFGLTLRDTGGALAVFGDNNIRGADAATKLAAAVRIMAAPSAAGAKWLSAIGISSLQLADDMRKGGLIQAIADLKKHLEASGATASQQAAILTNAFGRKQAAGVLLLVDQYERLRAKTKEVGGGAAGFGDAWTQTTKTLSFQIDQVKAAAQGFADKIGGDLIPVLSGALGWMLKNKRTMKDLGEGVLIATAAFVAFKTAMTIGAAAMAVATFATGGWTASFWALDAAMTANPVGIVIVAIAALAGGIIYAYNHSETFRRGVQSLARALRTDLGDALNFVINRYNDLVDANNAASGFIKKVTGGVVDFGQAKHAGNVNLTGSTPLSAGALKSYHHQVASQPGFRISPWQTTPFGATPVTVHTHVHLDSRQIAEAQAKYQLQLAARR